MPFHGRFRAEFFYGGDRFTRKGAMPPTAMRLLQDKGTSQQLDGLAHRHRKLMFMEQMTPTCIQELVDAMVDQWRSRIRRWEAFDKVVLHHEVQEMLCRAVCTWAGIPLSERSAKKRTREFTMMVEGAGSVGPRMVWGMVLRARNLSWAESVISKIRSGHPSVATGSPVHAIAWHQDLDGELLEPKIAAVELVNLLRPTLAVDRFVTVAVLALHRYPECRDQLLDGDDAALERFVHEVRRYYPFFPFMGAGSDRAQLAGASPAPRRLGHSGCLWHESRSAHLGRSRRLPAGAVPPLGRERVQLHPAGRWRLRDRSLLPR